MKKLSLTIIILFYSLNILSQELSSFNQLGWDEKIKQADKFVKKKDFQSAIDICNNILNYQIYDDKSWIYYSYTTSATDILFKIYSSNKNEFFDEKKALKYLKINNDHFKLYNKLLSRESNSGSLASLKNTIREFLPQSDQELADYLIKTGLTLKSLDDEDFEIGKKNENPIVDEKVVILTTVGQGSDQDQARNRALRSAIEQAFGTYISSNASILNDQLIKDDIISINNGNVEKYEIMNESKLADNLFVSTLKVTVSVNKLIKYSQSKGVSLEFQGGLFASNILNQTINDKNELIAWRNLKIIIEDLMKKSFEYKIKYTEPQKVDNNWYVPIAITVSYNSNFEIINNLIFDFLKSTSLSNNEVISYLKTNREVFPIVYALNDIKYGQFFLRNYVVRDSIFTIPQNSFLIALNNFNIDNGIEIKDFIGYLKYFENFKYNLNVLDHTRKSEIFRDRCYTYGFFGIALGNQNEFNISPLVAENFKILNNSTFYEQFRWKSGNLDHLLSYNEDDFYYNPTRLINNCIAEHRWYDPNQNFSFLTTITWIWNIIHCVICGRWVLKSSFILFSHFYC
jgi:hypothetical protein